MSSKKLTVAVLAGGVSVERKISLLSGAEVASACRQLGYRVLHFDPAEDLAKLIKAKNNIDVVFPALHGQGGEDGSIQGLLTLLGLPYIGSAMRGAAMAFDKIAAKGVYRRAGLPVARDWQADKIDPKLKIESLKSKINYPCFVKPASEGSSYGAGIVHERSELASALRKTWRYDRRALIEEYLAGTEITVGILDDDKQLQALPVVEIRPKTGWFDLKSKYDPKLCDEIVPAQISARLTRQAQNFAKKAHLALSLRHLSRTDMIIRKEKIYLLETNVMPGLTKNSLLPKMALAAGLSFPQLIERLIRLSLQSLHRKPRKTSK